MFSSVGWGEIFVLVVAALVILGPERLPGAIKWTTGSIKKVREYATGASNQLRDEFGADFDDIRKPIQQLNELRGMSPRSMITKHLLDGDDSVIRDIEELGRQTKDDINGAVKPSAKMYKPDMSKPGPAKPALDPQSPPPIDPDAT